MNQQCVDFLLDLQDELDSANILPNHFLKIYTRIKRGDQSWRGHPNYRGLGPWRDWAWVNYGKESLPCHIWCFVTIPPLQGKRIEYGGIRLEEGLFAVVECGEVVKNWIKEHSVTTIIHPIEKLVGKDKEGRVLLKADGTVKERIYYLADTDAFVGPCCVVPDIGGPINRYWVIEPRNLWGGYFEDWLFEELDDDMKMEEEQEDKKKKKEGAQMKAEDDEINHDVDTDPESGEEEEA